MKVRLIYIFSLSLLAVLPAWSQEGSSGRPANHISIGIDYPKLVSFLFDFETKIEGQLGILLKNHYHLGFEYGYAELKPEEAFENGDYTSSGTYWRVGMDYLFELTPKNNLMLGFRYGSTDFDDSFKITVGSLIFPDYELERTGLSATWYEVGLATETKLMPSLIAGLKLKLKILGDYDSPDPVEPYAIPGYGRSFDNSIPNLNLYIKYLLRF